eukprot:7862042-Ditylum_brightwellii.AAC.1
MKHSSSKTVIILGERVVQLRVIYPQTVHTLAKGVMAKVKAVGMAGELHRKVVNGITAHCCGRCADWKVDHGTKDNCEKCLFNNLNLRRANKRAPLAVFQAAIVSGAETVQNEATEPPAQRQGGHVIFCEPLGALVQNISDPVTTTALSAPSVAQWSGTGNHSDVASAS